MSSEETVALNIAQGLALVLTFADEPTNPKYREGIDKLSVGIKEALELLELPKSLVMRTRSND